MIFARLLKKTCFKALLGLVLLGLTTPSAAANFSGVFATNTPAKTKLKSQLETNNFKGAFYSWFTAVDDTRFSDSDTGKALFALILFNNGYTHLGVEQLFSAYKPANIHPKIKRAWRQIAPVHHKVWKSVQVKWNKKWKSVFPEMDAVSPFSSFYISSGKKLKTLQKIQRRSRGEVYNWVTYQLASWAAIHDRTSYGIQLTKQLLKVNSNVVNRNQLLLLQGRLFYQDRQFSKAIASYSRISRRSDFWLEALEEIAWANLRLNKKGQALAKLKTLSAPTFSAQVGPEPYFLTALIHLKTCNYEGVFRVVDLFKKRHRQRSVELQKLAKTGENSITEKMLKTFLKKEVSWRALGTDVAMLPKYFDRDKFFLAQMEARRNYTREAKSIRKVYKFLTAQNTTRLESLAKNALRTADKQKLKALDRLRYLARANVTEYSLMLQKFQVAEAESIHRLYGVQKVADAPDHSKIDRSKYLVFPGSKEVWLDEIDNYRIKVGNCPNKKTAKVL